MQISRIRTSKKYKNMLIEIKTKEYEHLLASIKTHGITTPLILNKSNVVLAGHHRLKAAKQLNLKHVPVIRANHKNKNEEMLCVLNDNLARRNITNVERYQIYKNIKPALEKMAHENMKKGGKGCSVEQTLNSSRDAAEQAGITPSQARKLAIIEKYGGTTVLKKIQNDRASIAKSYNCIKSQNDRNASIKALEKYANTCKKKGIKNCHVHNYRFQESKIPDESVDLIITDPPYVQEFLHETDSLFKFASKKLKNNGFLVTYYGQVHLDTLFECSAPHRNIRYYWLITEFNKHHTAIVHSRNITCGYMPIVVFQKLSSNQNKCKPTTQLLYDVVSQAKKEKTYHDWQKSEQTSRKLIQHFMRDAVGNTVCDPFAGSGTNVIASLKLGYDAIGYETDKETYKIMRARIKKECG